MPSRDRESSFQGLVEAGIAISSELTLDGLLQLLVEKAAGLTGARYAALGVIDVTGHELERFVTHGIDPETHAAIGDLPRGRGILGVLIRDVGIPERLRVTVGVPEENDAFMAVAGEIVDKELV